MNATPAYDPDNIFAKILRGEIPCHKVYEDDDFIAFMDVMPQTPGHTLVLPKAPCRNLLDAPPQVLSRILPLVQRLAQAVKTAMGAEGITISQFNEHAGGQTVFHLHIHIIPRHEDQPMKHHARGFAPKEELEANAAKIRAAIG
ncbi:MAG: HIT family protein [Hyphomicrobiaceae bacterium]|nr:HIT family protein [Hyphomicrobiaceae bacterium]